MQTMLEFQFKYSKECNMTCLGIKTQRKGLESNLRLAKQFIGHFGNKE